MDFAAKSVTGRSARAYSDRQNWAQLYNQLYDYAIPNRRPARVNGVQSNQSGGGSGMEKVFDATATKAAFRFAGRMSRDVTPPFQRFFELQVGPALKSEIYRATNGDDQMAKENIQQTEKDLEQVTGMVSAVLETAQFALAADEMYLDLFGGQGALLMLEDEDEVMRFTAVPVGEIALREDGMGRVHGIYWEKIFKADTLKIHWPKGKFSAETEKKIKEDANADICILQATEYDCKAKRWVHLILEKDKTEAEPIEKTDDMLTCPWLTPRFWKVPGEAMGRGPGLAALPTIKTVNKITELTLKAVAFAVLGLWTYRNDRTFNPKTARMYPGAMWAVSSNGGTMGPALQRQEMPGRYDVSNIVLQDLREQVKQTTFDDALPPDSGAVRSATEIVERMKRLMSDLAGAYPRLLLEIVIPLVKRVIDVLYRRKLISAKLPIDQLILKVQITSPIARAQAAQDVSSIVEWLQLMISLTGMEPAMLMAKIEEIYPAVGKMLGVSPAFIRTPKEREGLQKMVAQLIAAAQMQAQQAKGGAPPQAAPPTALAA
jgi:hypothetical protein